MPRREPRISKPGMGISRSSTLKNLENPDSLDPFAPMRSGLFLPLKKPASPTPLLEHNAKTSAFQYNTHLSPDLPRSAVWTSNMEQEVKNPGGVTMQYQGNIIC